MTWLKNLNATPKLMLSFGVILAFSAAIGTIGSYNLAEQNGRGAALLQQDVDGLQTVAEFAVEKAQIATTTRNAIIHSAKPDSKADVAKDQKRFEEQFSELESHLKRISELYRTPSGKALIAKIADILPEYRRRVFSIFEAAIAGDAGRAAALLKANTEFIGQLNSLTTQANKQKLEVLNQTRLEVNRKAQETRSTVMKILAGTTVIGLFMTYLIARSFSTPLIAAVNLLEEVGHGDLSQRLIVTSKDEIGTLGSSLNRAIDSMDRALSEVGVSAKNLSASSHQLARAAEALASGAQEQAASLQETSASLEEITATIRQNSDNARHASQLAVSSKDSAEKGGVSAVETIAAMSEIKTSSAKISEIITAIDEIAFQTNLLSVNASVEAARAGVHGSGFKVVATEVRNLAQRSAASAKEIKSLINSSVRKVENGSNLVTNSGSTLKEIVSSVKRVSDIVGEIAAASQEQATGIEQVGKAMTQMDRVTQSNSSQTEELSATASSLASQSSHLESLVSRFILTETGPAPAESAPGRRATASAASTKTFVEIPHSASLPADAVGGDLNVNLQSMAKNVGHSVLSPKHDQEFEEF